MSKDNAVFILTKVLNIAHHRFTFGKTIEKPYAIIPHDKPFEPLSVERECFGKEDLETLDVVIDCLQASDAVGALRDKGISAFAIAELRLFFTTVFLKHLQAEHTLDEMHRVNEMFDTLIHELVRQEKHAKKLTASEFICEHFAEVKELLKTGKSKKKALSQFAQKHGQTFHETSLLRAFNSANRRRK